MNRRNKPQTPRAFVVVEPDPIINLDLVTMIRGTFDDGQVSAVQSWADAASLISAIHSHTTILINGALLNDRRLDTLRNVVSRGAYIVIVGKDILTDFPKAVVEVPFTTEMILTALRNGVAD
ncbi:hypothetical protein [Yoonia sp. 2307UL14-13]|uniref:hypothetical protein n=1 Tax=Yoonia sp. 2307UL14-13 TaxID=3126506 RepID=UPI00309B648F